MKGLQQCSSASFSEKAYFTLSSFRITRLFITFKANSRPVSFFLAALVVTHIHSGHCSLANDFQQVEMTQVHSAAHSL